MGNFFTNLQVRGSRDDVVEAAGRSYRGRPAFYSDEANGWVSVYPEVTEDQDRARLERLAKSISKRLDTVVIAFLVHDDDILDYALFAFGRRRDRYDSAPDYFGPVSAKKAAASAGDAEVLRSVCGAPATAEAIAAVLDRDADFAFAHERLDRLAELLGITPERTTTGFTYLEEALEDDPDLIRVPARGEGGAYEQAVAATKRATLRSRLRAEGDLLWFDAFDRAELGANRKLLGVDDERIWIWERQRSAAIVAVDLETGEERSRTPTDAFLVHFAMSPDRKHFVGSRGASVAAFTLSGDTVRPGWTAQIPGGNRVLSCGDTSFLFSEQQRLVHCDLDSGAERRALPLPRGLIVDQRQDRLLIASCDSFGWSLGIVDAESWKATWTWDDMATSFQDLRPASSLAWLAPDLRHVLVATEDGGRVIDIEAKSYAETPAWLADDIVDAEEFLTRMAEIRSRLGDRTTTPAFKRQWEDVGRSLCGGAVTADWGVVARRSGALHFFRWSDLECYAGIDTTDTYLKDIAISPSGRYVVTNSAFLMVWRAMTP